MYDRLQPDVADRIDSFQNYVLLFNIVLGLDSEAPEFLIPAGWLWDIVDEFIYQFEEFHQYRGRAEQLTDTEINILKSHPHVCSRLCVRCACNEVVMWGYDSLGIVS